MFKPVDTDDQQISLDDAIQLIIDHQAAKKAIETKISNLKEVVKFYMNALEVKHYTAPTGHIAQFVSSNNTKLDKKAIQELLGDDFSKVVSFKTVEKFMVK